MNDQNDKINVVELKSLDEGDGSLDSMGNCYVRIDSSNEHVDAEENVTNVTAVVTRSREHRQTQNRVV